MIVAPSPGRRHTPECPPSSLLLPVPQPVRPVRCCAAAARLTGVVGFAALTLAAAQAQPSPQAPVQATEIGVYSGRHYNTDKQLYQRFTARTGIKVKLLEAKDDALIERLRSEGANSPADVLVLVDAARLDKAADLGLFRASPSAALLRDVPLSLRDAKGRWYGLTRRVRVAIVNPKLVNPATIRRYADLALPSLRGKLCLRDRRSVYNQSLVADQLILRGPKATAQWVEGMIANVSRPLYSSDTPLIRAVGNGECGVGLVNTYYVARMLAGDSGRADQQLAGRLKVLFPDPAHVNISGAGVVKTSRHPQAALKLIEFLASPSGGRGYAEANNEYPLRGSGNNPILKRFGPFRADGVSAEQLGAKNKQAVKLMEANGWR